MGHRTLGLASAITCLCAPLLIGCGDGEEGGKTSGAGGSGGAAGAGGTAGAGGAAGSGGALLDPLFDDDRVPVTETMNVEALRAPVDVVRDKYGHVHIFARNIDDLFYVQGWMMMKDRAGMLELARRLATGRIAELYGALQPSLVDDDIAMRAIGLARVGKEMYDAIEEGSEPKRVFDSFSAGISAYSAGLNDGSLTLHSEFVGMKPEQFEPWTGADSLAMGRVQSWNLSYEAGNEIALTELWNEVLATYNDQSTDPDIVKRAGYARDVMRWTPSNDATPLTGYPDLPTSMKVIGPPPANARKAPGLVAGPKKAGLTARPKVPAGLFERARPFLRSVQKIKNLFGYDEHSGSNNWAVAGSHTESGNAIVASDPHLGFTSPMIFWPCHLVVDNPDDPAENMDVSGLAFVGIPGVILGSNAHVAWGATTSLYDVTDVWAETVTADGSGVMFKGQAVDFERIPETVKDGNGGEVSFDVLFVPHHGPIVPTIDDQHQVVPPTAASGAFSVHWTGHDPTTEIEAIFGLFRATNVDEAMATMNQFGVGSQNWMLADTSGNIAWTSHVLIPHRDPRTMTWDPATYTGIHPGFVLDGESGEHEWTGEFLDERYVPKERNPSRGWAATANTDNIGTNLDNDPTNELLSDGTPFYIGWEVAEGFRLNRIQERLDALTTGGNKTTAEAMAALQGDTKSGVGSRLAPMLVATLERAEAEKASPGTNPETAPAVADPRYDAADVADVIDALKKWGADSDYDAASGISPEDNTPVTDAAEANASKATFIFNAWFVRVLARTMEDEARRVGGRQNVRTAFTVRGFFRIVEETPANLATFDAATGESALWDNIDTVGVTERRDEVVVMALLDAIDDGNAIFGADRNTWRWGRLHTVRFDPLNPLWSGLTIPPEADPTFADGFPRPGDMWAVDASNFNTNRSAGSGLSFSYGGGPVQRFVAEMTPSGPAIRNALPGGAVADSSSKHFANQAELWRRNETHAVARSIEEIVAAYESDDEHLRFTP